MPKHFSKVSYLDYIYYDTPQQDFPENHNIFHKYKLNSNFVEVPLTLGAMYAVYDLIYNDEYELKIDTLKNRKTIHEYNTFKQIFEGNNLYVKLPETKYLLHMFYFSGGRFPDTYIIEHEHEPENIHHSAHLDYKYDSDLHYNGLFDIPILKEINDIFEQSANNSISVTKANEMTTIKLYTFAPGVEERLQTMFLENEDISNLPGNIPMDLIKSMFSFVKVPFAKNYIRGKKQMSYRVSESDKADDSYFINEYMKFVRNNLKNNILYELPKLSPVSMTRKSKANLSLRWRRISPIKSHKKKYRRSPSRASPSRRSPSRANLNLRWRNHKKSHKNGKSRHSPSRRSPSRHSPSRANRANTWRNPRK